jgi:hypothetical protein
MGDWRMDSFESKFWKGWRGWKRLARRHERRRSYEWMDMRNEVFWSLILTTDNATMIDDYIF